MSGCSRLRVVPIVPMVSVRNKHGDFVAKLCRAARISKVESYFLDRFFILQAPVVQTLDSAIHRINHYPADK